MRTTTKFSSASVGSCYCQFIVVLCCENKSAFIVVLCCCQFIVVLCCCQFIVVLCCENYARRRSHAPHCTALKPSEMPFKAVLPLQGVCGRGQSRFKACLRVPSHRSRRALHSLCCSSGVRSDSQRASESRIARHSRRMARV